MIRLSREQLIGCIVNALERYRRTNEMCRGRDNRGAASRAGDAITVQGVIGEFAFYKLMGLDFDDFNDTTPRSTASGSDILEDAHNEVRGGIVTVDIKTCANAWNGHHYQVHVVGNKEAIIERGKENAAGKQTRLIGHDKLKRVYMLMWIKAGKGSIDAMVKDYKRNGASSNLIPESLDVGFVGWIQSNQLWGQCGGKLSDLTHMYGSSTNPWRFTSKRLCKSWEEFVYYWKHGRLQTVAQGGDRKRQKTQ